MFFYLSKLFWIFFNPINLLVILLLIGIFFQLIKKKIYKKIYQINLILFFLIVFFPTGTYLLWKLENTYPKQEIANIDIDGVLILGAGIDEFMTYEYKQMILNDRIERITESAKIIKKFPNAKIIYSGGNGTFSKPKLKSDEVANIFYKQLGVNTDRIIFENKSRNTYENILFSKQIAKPQEDEKWLLVTSAFHMKRAILISKKQKWKFIPYPVDFKQSKKISLKPSIHFFSNFTSFQKAFHEWLGLFSYYLMGRTDNFF